jgi:hypothetical protein
MPAVKDTQQIRKNIAQNSSLLFDGNFTTLRRWTKEDKKKSQSISRFELWVAFITLFNFIHIKAYDLTHNLPIYL